VPNYQTHYDWEAAFHYWVMLGHSRSIEAVQEHFGIGQRRTVTRAMQRYGWRERLAKVEAEAHEKADALLIRERAHRIADTLKIIDAARSRFAGQLARADFRMTASDFVGLIKLEVLLEGGATERIQGLPMIDPEKLTADELDQLRALLVKGTPTALDEPTAETGRAALELLPPLEEEA